MLLFRVLLAVLAASVACSRAVPPEPALHVLLDRDVEGLDPHASGNHWHTQNALLNLYEGLVGVDREMHLVPAIALSWSNPDELTWEFRLRPNVRFHDGGTLGPGDVVWSFERARTHPRSYLRAAVDGITSVLALADGVRLTTRDPDATLPQRLRQVLIASRACVERVGDAGLDATSCGTGPYRLGARAAGEFVDLERFAQHWEAPGPFRHARLVARSYGAPDLDRLAPPGQPRVWWTPIGTPLYRQAEAEGVMRHGRPTAIVYLGFDLRGETTAGVTGPVPQKNVFLDPRVRRAVALAIDRPRLLADAADGEGNVADQIAPPLVIGFKPGLPAPVHDPAEGVRLLREAGFASGIDVRLDVRQMLVRFGPPIVRDLAAIGVRATPETIGDDAFFARLTQGRSSLWLLRWSTRTGDAQEMLDRWAHAPDPARGLGDINHAWTGSLLPGLDAEIDAARRELVPDKRMAKLRAVLKRLADADVVVPLIDEQSAVFLSPGLEWQPRADTMRLVREFRAQ